MKNTLITLTIALLLYAESMAQPVQWRGEQRDGWFRKETNLLKQWPQEGPEMVLKVDNVGKGFSSPVVHNGTIYITGMKDTLDYLTAIDMQGNTLWQVAYGRSWVKSFPDTRSSPTIDDNRVYVLAGTGILSCYQTGDGSLVWSVDVDKDYQAEWHQWGVSESPLVIGDLVICSPGGSYASVVAFNKLTGQEVWRTPVIGGQRSYVSPTLYEHNGIRLILAATAIHLAAIRPENGEVAWTYNYMAAKEWDQPGLIWANTPIWNEDQVYISMGYNFPSKMLKMNAQKNGVEEIFTNTVLDNHHHGVVLVDGYVYASNWINNGKGNWVCMDWNTGDIKWETEWENKGSVIYADGLLYLYEEKRGNVALVRPNPEKLDIISTFRIAEGSGPHWAHPFISGGKLFIRHGEVLMVFNISG